MTRRCSHCSTDGHNSRTCPNRVGGVVKLFGVRLTNGSIQKSASMGNLTHHVSAANLPPPDHAGSDGYVSEDFVAGSSSACQRKKGVPWTEEEHRMFLLGLHKLGKGDWRGISRNFVVSRTPTQVASHAQKYFIRQSSMFRRKRRSSLFDIIAEEDPQDPEFHKHQRRSNNSSSNNSRSPPPPEEECESMASTNSTTDAEKSQVANPNPPAAANANCYYVIYTTGPGDSLQ